MYDANGWAPMQMIAVAGLRRYGYSAAADRISINFLSLILKEFNEHNVIVEKYDVERRDSQINFDVIRSRPSNTASPATTQTIYRYARGLRRIIASIYTASTKTGDSIHFWVVVDSPRTQPAERGNHIKRRIR